MNCPSRVDDTLVHDGWNQNPPSLAADVTTRHDLNGRTNSTAHRDHRDEISILQIGSGRHPESDFSNSDVPNSDLPTCDGSGGDEAKLDQPPLTSEKDKVDYLSQVQEVGNPANLSSPPSIARQIYGKICNIMLFCKFAAIKYASFAGPGFLIAVAYIDP